MQLPFHNAIGYSLLAIRKACHFGKRAKGKWQNGGFTLIELLVVISIIGILMAAGTVYFTNTQQKGRDSKRKADIKSLQQALELYYNANGDYPPAPVGSTGWCTYLSNPGATTVKDALVPTYISSLPKDPTKAGSPGDYFYYKTSKSQYKLASILENTNDPEKGTYNYSPCWGSEVLYQYQVTQP